jgi:hypothetical protein
LPQLIAPDILHKILMLRRHTIFFTASSLLVLVVFLFWHQGRSRRGALLPVSPLASDLEIPCGAELLNTVMMPVTFQSQTPVEQEEFVAKALVDEISQKDVLALKQPAEFGSAKAIFPAEYAGWRQRAGVEIPTIALRSKWNDPEFAPKSCLCARGKITVWSVVIM